MMMSSLLWIAYSSAQVQTRPDYHETTDLADVTSAQKHLTLRDRDLARRGEIRRLRSRWSSAYNNHDACTLVVGRFPQRMDHTPTSNLSTNFKNVRVVLQQRNTTKFYWSNPAAKNPRPLFIMLLTSSIFHTQWQQRSASITWNGGSSVGELYVPNCGLPPPSF